MTRSDSRDLLTEALAIERFRLLGLISLTLLATVALLFVDWTEHPISVLVSLVLVCLSWTVALGLAVSFPIRVRDRALRGAMELDG